MALSVQFQNGQLQYSNVTASDAGGTTTDTFGPIVVRTLLSDGTGANQANKASRDFHSLTDASTTYTLSALPGSQGLAKARMLFVQVLTGGTLAILPGTSNGWPGVTIGTPLVAGSILLVTWPAVAGAAVGSGATDQIKFTAVGAVTFIAAFVGTDA